MLEPELLGLVKRKLGVSGKVQVDVSPARLASLRAQLAPELHSVLLARQFAEFDLERAFALVVGVAESLERIP